MASLTRVHPTSALDSSGARHQLVNTAPTCRANPRSLPAAVPSPALGSHDARAPGWSAASNPLPGSHGGPLQGSEPSSPPCEAPSGVSASLRDAPASARGLADASGCATSETNFVPILKVEAGRQALEGHRAEALDDRIDTSLQQTTLPSRTAGCRPLSFARASDADDGAGRGALLQGSGILAAKCRYRNCGVIAERPRWLGELSQR